MAKILTNTLTDILIETPRLLIGSIIPEAERATPIKSDICATLYQDVFSDPDVMRYLLEGRCLPCEGTQAYIASHFSSSDNQLGLKGVIEKTSGSLIGFCGMVACDDLLNQLERNNATISYQYLTNTNRPAPSEDILLAVELGYALSRKYWGRGYAYEMAMAQFEYAACHFPDAVIFACSHPDNLPSTAILHKLPMQYLATISHPIRGERCVYSQTSQVQTS